MVVRLRLRSCWPVVLTAGLLGVTFPADAQFREPIEISVVDEGAVPDFTRPRLACDTDAQLAVVFESEDARYYAASHNRFSNFDVTLGLDAEHGPIRVASGDGDAFHIVYVQEGDVLLRVDPEAFVFPTEVDGGSGESVAADVAVGTLSPGEVAYVWQEGEGATAEVFLSNSTVNAEELGPGEAPRVRMSSDDGSTHVVWREGEGLRYQRWLPLDVTPGFDLEIPTPAGVEGEFDFVAGADAGNFFTVTVAFINEDTGEIYTSVLADGAAEFDDYEATTRAADTLALGLEGSGRLALAYAIDGEIVIVEDFGGISAFEHSLTEVDSGAGNPTLAIDVRDAIHVAYDEDGRIYYTNNVSEADEPEAAFLASPPDGIQPVTVHFENVSTGVVWYADWDFGEAGESPSYSDVEALFTDPGVFSVTLTVTGPGGVNTVTVDDAVIVDAAPFSMRLGPRDVVVGERDVHHAVMGAAAEDVFGFGVCARFEGATVEVERVDLGASIAALEPEFVQSDVDNDPVDGYAVLGVIFEWIPPVDTGVLAASEELELATLVYHVNESVETGSVLDLRLENGAGDPPVFNTYSVASPIGVVSELAYLDNGPITTFSPFPFLRGDTNGNGVLGMSDAQLTLTYLFANAEPPYCLDTADINDDGILQLLDALLLLDYLFTNGAPPAPPFPAYGLDETPDVLGACASEAP